MEIYRTKENNFRVRVEKNEHVSIKPGPSASVATSGQRGGHIVSGCFAAISMKTTLPNPEFMEEFVDFDINIFCRSKSSCKNGSSDIEIRAHINITGYEYILAEQLLHEDLKFLDYLGIQLYQQVL